MRLFTRISFVTLAVVTTVLVLFPNSPAFAGRGETSAYKVLQPIESGALSVFPVVSAEIHDTTHFMTLDEGLRSGDVVVTVAGNVVGLVRGPYSRLRQECSQVNTLVLINHSVYPLNMLDCKIVHG